MLTGSILFIGSATILIILGIEITFNKEYERHPLRQIIGICFILIFGFILFLIGYTD